MFALPRHTRIRLCRLGLIALCALPTVVVAGWIIGRRACGNATAQKIEWERELSLRSGLVVELGDVSYPAPRIARLSDVRFLAPAASKTVALATSLEVEQTSAGWQVTPRGLVIDADELAALHSACQRCLAPATAASVVIFLPSDMILKQGAAGQTLSQARAVLHCGPSECRLDLEFHLPGNGSQQPARLVARKSRDEGAVAEDWQLVTAGQTLPCSLAASLAPELARLGADCQFEGRLHWRPSVGASSGEIVGTLTHVDLDALVTEHFPHQLSGLAKVVVERATVADGRLTELRGHISADSGWLSHSLVAAAQEHLQLAAPETNAAAGSTAPLPYDRLAAAFELSGPWLTLSSNISNQNAGAVLMHGEEPLLVAPPQHAVTTASLLRVLVPDSQHLVPATKQTSGLVRLLPLPEVTPAAQQPIGHTPTRLVPTQPAASAAVRQPVLR